MKCKERQNPFKGNSKLFVGKGLAIFHQSKEDRHDRSNSLDRPNVIRTIQHHILHKRKGWIVHKFIPMNKNRLIHRNVCKDRFFNVVVVVGGGRSTTRKKGYGGRKLKRRNIPIP